MSQFPVSENIHLDTNTCYTYLMMDAGYNAKNEYNNYLDSVTNAFQAAYITHCMNIDDSFRMVMPFQEYHYTLYYYDQAGNLVKTIPPQGVHPITNATLLADITNYRAGTYGTPTYPTDSLMTHYFYNTLNSPSKQQTPDGDSVHYWYDALGRIVLSQNALQRPAFYHYDYTLYDDLNRITEVGEVSTVPQNLPSCFKCNSCIIKYGVLPVLPDTFARKEAEVVHFINMGTKTQIVHTYYDTVTYKSIPLSQQNLRKRISTITYKKNNTNPDSGINYYNSALHYSYDIEGNVSTLLLDVPGDSLVHQRYKRLDYYYDLVSGKVNQLIYQHDSIDQFIHVYTYDADNRITDVETSMDSLYWENDASYEYYDHGPLAREVIGQRQVQGIDYAYTLNGWIKGVNSSLGSYKVHMWPNYDMGGDGYGHGANKTIGRDAYGYVLNYFTGDYRSIAKTYFTGSGLPATSLYNGNISGATYAIRQLSPAVIGYTYGYDQLNRIVSTLAFKGIDTTNNTWPPADSIKDFREKVSYDENGNILTYLRHGNTSVGPLAMDSLNYNYNKGTNQLAQVKDAVPSTNYTVDIDNEPSHHNYRYNAIGELASDSIAGIDTIMWTMYHKVHKIVKTNNDSIVFVYDPLGNRLLEKYFLHTGTADTTKYVRDAQGNIMAIYDRKKDTVRLTEWDIYGSKRLGSLDTLLRIQKLVTGHGTIDSLTISYLERQKQYELDNHLGNVLVTVSDGKTPVDTLAGHDTISYYVPIVINAQDYYPFGMVEPGRSYTLGNDSSYKYLFNGKLHDDNIYGKDNSYDYGARFYDPRLGRFMSTDPLFKKYAMLSTYQFASNKPIQAIDEDGMESNNTTGGDANAQSGQAQPANNAGQQPLKSVTPADVASHATQTQTPKIAPKTISSDQANAEYYQNHPSDNTAPYPSGKTVQQGPLPQASESDPYVRVSGGNANGEFFTKYSQIKGMTPAQAQNALQTTFEPTQMNVVKPGDVPVNAGPINNPSAPQGSTPLTQYQFLTQDPASEGVTYGPAIQLQSNQTIQTTVQSLPEAATEIVPEVPVRATPTPTYNFELMEEEEFPGLLPGGELPEGGAIEILL